MKILVVTACPSGLAHTYMAAEALENASKERNIEIKVETQGCLGIDNKITAEDLKGTDFVILTEDMEIEEVERFNRLPIFKVEINDIVQNPGGIIENLQSELNSQKLL